MTVTYTEDTVGNDALQDEIFVPRYARTNGGRKKGGVRAWMILAPVGALALLGGAAMIWMSGDTGETALVAQEPPAPMIQSAAPLESSTSTTALTSGLPSNVTITEATPVAATPAPVARDVAPEPVAVQRRAPVQRQAAPVEPAPVVETAPVEPTGPQPYTATLNSQPSAQPGRAPAIQPAPLN